MGNMCAGERNENSEENGSPEKPNKAKTPTELSSDTGEIESKSSGFYIKAPDGYVTGETEGSEGNKTITNDDL